MREFAERRGVELLLDVLPRRFSHVIFRQVPISSRTSSSVFSAMTEGIFSGRGSLRDQSGRRLKAALPTAAPCF
jgi:hypothetical protein